MDKKLLTIVLAVVLIGCFFLAYIKGYPGDISGYDLVFSGGSDNWEKYLLLLIPLSGLLLLIGALNNGNYIGGRGLWTWLPLLAVLYFLIIGPVVHGRAIGDVFKNLGKGYGVGLWITIGASLVLALYNPRKG